MKNTLEGINSRLDEAEDWIRDLEDNTEKYTDSEKQKKNFFNEDSLRDLWDNMKHKIICIMEVPEERRESKRLRTYLKK